MRSFRNLFVLLMVLSSLASATILQTFTARTTWEAATSGRVDIDFSSLSLPLGYQSYGTSSGLTTGGVTIVGVLDSSTYYLYALNPPSGADENFGTGQLIRGPEYRTTSYLRISLPTATTSFGIDLMTAFPRAESFTIQLDGVDVGSVITTNSSTPTFFGVTTTGPISEVTIRLNSGTLNNTSGLFDNIGYGAAGSGGGGGGGETPEVATMLGAGSGLLLMRWMARRAVATPATA